jgi:hypothetical protein
MADSVSCQRFVPEDIPPVTQYEEVSPADFVDILRNVDERREHEKIADCARAVAGLNLYIERSLYEVVQSNPKFSQIRVPILPDAVGRDSERISTIQPTAWILDGAGCYYDPGERRLMKNIVDHWNGTTRTLNGYVWKSLISPCFLAYHLMVIAGLIMAIIFWTRPASRVDIDHPWVKVVGGGLILGIPLAYDLAAIIVVFIWERFFEEPGKNSVVASELQFLLSERLNFIIMQLCRAITSSSDPNDKKPGKTVGSFIISNFYEKVVTRALVRSDSPADSWAYVENVLTVYRFIREIAETNVVDLGISVMQLNASRAHDMRLFLAKAIKEGSPEVHLQLLRLLYNGHLGVDERSDLARQRPSNLCMNHYLGYQRVVELEAKVRLDLGSAKMVADPVRLENMEIGLGLRSWDSRSGRSRGESARRGGPEPSHFSVPG